MGFIIIKGEEIYTKQTSKTNSTADGDNLES